MKITYTAIDGTSFDNEGACEDYENDYFAHKMIMLDTNFKRTFDFEEVDYLYLTDDAEVEFASKKFCLAPKYRRVVYDSSFCETGFYYAESDSYYFAPLSEAITKAHLLIQNLELAREAMIQES